MEGKKVYLELANRRKYTGTIISINENFIILNDKFGKEVWVNKKDVTILQEEGR